MGDMARPSPSRLSRRLLAWLLALSLLPLLVTNAVGYGRSQGIIERLVARYLGAVAQEQAQHARDRIDRHLLLMNAVASGNAFLLAGARHAMGLPSGAMGDVATPAEVTRLLQRKLGELPGFSALYVFSPGGLLIAAAGRSDDAVTASLPGDLDQTSVDVVPAGGGRAAPLFRLLSPIKDSANRVVAMLGGTVTMQAFRDVLDLPPHLSGDVESFVIDDDGRPLVTTRPNASVDYAKPLPQPINSTPGSAALYSNLENVEVFGASAAIPGYRWRIVVEASAAGALDDLRRLGELSLVLEALLIGGVVIVAWLVASGIVAPLRRLVRATERVGQGDLDARVPVDSDDEIGDLGRAFNDMTTALAEANALLRQAHEREIARASQLATVGELASGVAHEIKNPLVGISTGLDLVRRHVTDAPQLNPIMDEMTRQLDRIQGTLHDLLAFARPAAPTLSPVSPRAVIDRALRLVYPAAEKQGVAIVVEADPALPRFLADEEMLRQALVNVLMNAVQATPTGGAITVRAQAGESWVEIVVADSGHGIAAADVETVFKPFFTTRHTGTGLGLPITREIVERHGGSLQLHSDVGHGTSVTMRFPARAPSESFGVTS